MDIESLLETLRTQRPIFHSERDFQCSLAELMRDKGYSNVNLEVPGYDDLIGYIGEKNRRVDIVADGRVAIELKFPPAPLSVTCNGDDFHLKGSKSVIKGRYRFWKDLWRVEQLVNNGVVKTGYAITITNRDYWSPKKKEDWLSDFATENGRRLSGSVKLRPELGGSRKILSEMKKDIFEFKYHYEVNWATWSNFGCPSGDFRYACMKCGE